LAHRKIGPARGALAAHRRQTAAISIITLGEFAEGFADPRTLVEFLAPFRVGETRAGGVAHGAGPSE
jgi:hypothetical protein